MVMYREMITTQDQALCHLFLHCCLRDGKFTPAEIDAVAGKYVALGLQKELNFKNETRSYQSYRDSISDESGYLKYLVDLIRPVNELALYSYCVELVISDDELSVEEEKLLEHIADVLDIDAIKQENIKSLVVQRKAVETEKFF